jgi:hypothetical protein
MTLLMGRLDFSLVGDESPMWRFGQCVLHSWSQTCTYWDGLVYYMEGLGGLLDLFSIGSRNVEKRKILAQYRGFIAPAHTNVN